MRGCFISLEGVEGSGKSQLQAYLTKALLQKGHSVVATREPGATTLGHTLRSILLDPNTDSISKIAELFLFAADRAQHVHEIISPSLEKGSIVLCDRYIHSTLAYQGYARGIDLKLLHNINNIATNGIIPELVLLLDVDPAIGLARARRRSDAVIKDSKDDSDSSWTRFEKQELAFHTSVRNGFLELASHDKNIITIDASEQMERVHQKALDAIILFINSIHPNAIQ